MSIICQIAFKIALIFFFIFVFELIMLATSIALCKIIDEIYYEFSRPILRKIEKILTPICELCENIKKYSSLDMSITLFCFAMFVSIFFIALALASIIYIF